ncbi:MAG: Non-ribosomal peptide synthase, partial [bacterium]
MTFKTNDLNDRIANLTPTQRALLELRLEKKKISASNSQTFQTSLPVITPVLRDKPLAISLSQEWWWLLEQFYPASPAYNVGLAIRFKGSLKVDILRKVLQEITSRHEILRTSFINIEGQAYQKIFPNININLEVVTVPENSLTEITQLTKQLATEEFSKTFDLSSCPLMRLKLFTLSPEDSLFLLTVHHIIVDGLSMGILTRDIIILYEAFSKGLSSPLPELDFQYADFALWQRKYLQGEILDKLTSYWKNKLKDIPLELDLPTDYQRIAEKTFIGKSHSFSINSHLIGQLKHLFINTSTTPFMLFLAVWKVLLYRYTGQEDVVVGTTVANRHFPEMENVLGLFINSLPLRTDLSGNPSFKQLVSRVQEVCIEAYAHQAIPYEKLLEHLPGKNKFNQTSLFQTVLMLHQTQGLKKELPDLTLSFPGSDDLANALADLTLHLSETNSDWNNSLVYNQNLFDLTTIERMKNHFLNLISAIVSNPNQPILELSLMTD